jgi:hypothetical protein
VVEENGEESQNRRRSSWAKTNRVVPVERRRYTVSCLQFVERKHMQEALCSTGYTSSKMVRKPHRRLSVGGIVTPLNNYFLRHPELPMDGRDV